MKRNIVKPSSEQIELLRRTGSENRAEALEAMHSLAQALQVPLRSALLDGDILGGIFAPEVLDPSATAEYPLDFYQTAQENDYVAYMIPSEGALPLRNIVGDAVTVSTFEVGNAIDWPLKYARSARWNIIARAMEVLEAGFVKKMNTDGWRVVIAAGAGRTDYNGGAPLVYDSAATAGQFTKRLVSLMKTTMIRLGGGNSATSNRSRLTDLYISPEALEDIREWDSDEVDDVTRREIFEAGDDTGPMAKIYGINLHPLDELGVGQEFQTYFDTLSVNMGTDDEEIVVGLDLSHGDSFVMPVKQPLSIFEDDKLHRRRRAGFYGWQEHGFAALDGRRVLLGSF
ncbi:hypothetical protein LCGC14_0426290 [marine sediment metagenome]|uniref:DUF2184 domain-containing protein n=1 Tax=marine sediment metagenome TaxID=412755 RepID=A0A0F9VBC9_9ZZZZ